MKTTSPDHPRFDKERFIIKAGPMSRWLNFFTGQPAQVVTALKTLTRGKDKEVDGATIRTFLERNRESFFPSCTRDEAVNVFRGYRSQLERAGIVRPLRG